MAAGIALQPDPYYSVLMRTISLKLPEALLAQLDQEARARRTTKSSVVRESLARTLSQEKPARVRSCFEVARDLAGSVRGLPEDLAVNPAYMEGFGR
jgi:Arc/MetJ-type ribon-helix-helix transcriptional regulator